ncbi:surfeit locus protein 2 [Hyperolius riggenbachi]|uniref:surfeit locus protein 2 n=1 Tax=Hyperolius riggenbachi TaxID=752182 RepID=UPI0035A2DF33
MEGMPEEVRQFLAEHPNLQPVPGGNKVRFTLTGHEFPCRLAELQNFTKGKKYKKVTESSADYSIYEPHIIPSTKNTQQLFCKLTLRHLKRSPEEVQRHTEGRRYQRALQKYEECQKLGVPYVPACLQNKSRQRHSEAERPAGKKEDMWEPEDSEESDSGDSMSDLYPDHMFTKKGAQNGNLKSNSEEEMDIEESVTNGHRKRPQRQQTGPSQKKIKSHHRKRPKNSKKSSKK